MSTSRPVRKGVPRTGGRVGWGPRRPARRAGPAVRQPMAHRTAPDDRGLALVKRFWQSIARVAKKRRTAPIATVRRPAFAGRWASAGAPARAAAAGAAGRPAPVGGKHDAGRVLPVTGASAVRAWQRPLPRPTISGGDHAGPAANYPGTLQADSSDGLHMIHIRPPRRRTRVGWSAVAAAGSVEARDESARDFFARLPGDAAATGGYRPARPHQRQAPSAVRSIRPHMPNG